MSEISKCKSNRVASAVFAILIAAAAPCAAEASNDGDCIEFNHQVVDQVAKGETKQAEAALSKALANSSNQAEGRCAGLTLGNLAAIVLDLGKAADAETFAERALSALGKYYPPNDRILLRPLQILCSAQFQQGKIGAARQVFERIRSIPADRPDDRAFVHGLRALLLMAENKNSEAEAEYLAAATAFEHAGRLQTAEAATNFAALASLYIGQQRYEEARRALDRAWELLTAAKDTVPADLINFLGIRSILHTRLAQWSEAEGDLLHAISLADHEAQMDPGIINSLLANYAVVLRKTHRRHQARAVEARVATLQNKPTAIVDVSELLRAANLRATK